MAISAPSSVTAGHQLPGAASAGAAAGSALGQADFLKLLMAQMQNQNPLEPVTDTQFVSQLSQFSTLQGIQQMNSSFSDMMLLQGLTQGANLLGKTVTFQQTGSNAIGRGVVDSVTFQGGKLQLVVGGKTVALSQVRGIEPSKTNN